jgi:hypothetical protein
MKGKNKKPKTEKLAGLAKSVKSAGRGGATADDEDTPMHQFGGPALDDDEDEQMEHPAPNGKGRKKGVPQNVKSCLLLDET